MRRYLFIAVLLLGFVTCRESYDMPGAVPVTGYLVVEGYINTTGITKINLRRTSQLAERRILPELNALIQIEGENSTVYPLNDLDSGRYASENLQLDPATKYRLHIKTQSTGDYVSNFNNTLRTPEIGSLTWKRTNGGVEIYVNAYAQHETSKYYKWDYEETWEFKSPHTAYLEWKFPQGGNPLVEVGWIDPVRYQPDSSRLFCWKSRLSTEILLGSTEKLSDNRLYVPITQIAKDAWELSRLYGIRILQTNLSKEAYEFYHKMKKNTESLGSIFDAQPSEIAGNMTSVNNPSEPVIGYVDVTSQTEKRLFISVAELPDWNYFESCLDSTIRNTPDLVLRYFYDGFVPTDVYSASPTTGLIGAFKAAKINCVDCRTRGTNIKPSFWP